MTSIHAKAIHDHYKNLAMEETAFRTGKTNHFEVRPVFVRTEVGTRGLLVVCWPEWWYGGGLKRAREDLDLNVGEGLGELNRICAMELSVPARMARMATAL